MKTFSFPSGRAWLTVKSSRPDPASRFEITVSDGAFIGAEGLIEAGKFLIAAGKEAIKEGSAPDLAETIAPDANGNANASLSEVVVTENNGLD